MPRSNGAPFDSILATLAAAGEATRLRLLTLLAEAELTVSELVTILGQSQPRVSRHLKLLVEAGLIERHREGRRGGGLRPRHHRSSGAGRSDPCRRPDAACASAPGSGRSGGALFCGS